MWESRFYDHGWLGMQPVRFSWTGFRVFLTYAGHLDQDALIQSLADQEGEDVGTCFKAWRVWHETTPDTGYDHTHCLVWYAAPKRVTECTYWNFEGVQAHVRRVSTNKHWRRCWYYHYGAYKHGEHYVEDSLRTSAAPAL